MTQTAEQTQGKLDLSSANIVGHLPASRGGTERDRTVTDLINAMAVGRFTVVTPIEIQITTTVTIQPTT